VRCNRMSGDGCGGDFELASPHGGVIAARGKDGALISDGALYRLRLGVKTASPESLVARAVRAALAVVLREWGM